MASPTAEQLIDGLRESGLRITRARREVCAVLAAGPDEHLTAAEVAERVEGSVDTITIYRTLETLERLGYVSHSHLGHGPGVYHVAPVLPHHHLVCEVCGTAVDVPARALEQAVAAVTGPHGFVADATHFAIVGRCRACAADDE